jgi:hypothetical protein
MSGPRDGWPVASLELTPSGDVVLQGTMWKLRPAPLTWQQGTIVRAENVRGAITGRGGVRTRGRYGMRAIFWCHNTREVIASLVDIGVPAVWSERANAHLGAIRLARPSARRIDTLTDTLFGGHPRPLADRIAVRIANLSTRRSLTFAPGRAVDELEIR